MYMQHTHVHVCNITYTHCRMSCEYQESQDGLLKEKQAYEAQLELLQRTVHEYEALMASKVSSLIKCILNFVGEYSLRENIWL